MPPRRVFAGHETTTNLIGNAVLALLRNPEQADLLRAHPELAPSAIEELMRYDGPTQAMVRVAVEDIEMEGRTIKRGDRIFTMINAANRDPRQFTDPDRVDLRRQNNRHLAFGYGIHFCIGAPLARLEGQLAVPALLRRYPDLALAAEPPWLPSLVFRGVKSLPATFKNAHLRRWLAASRGLFRERRVASGCEDHVDGGRVGPRVAGLHRHALSGAGKWETGPCTPKPLSAHEIIRARIWAFLSTLRVFQLGGPSRPPHSVNGPVNRARDRSAMCGVSPTRARSSMLL